MRTRNLIFRIFFPLTLPLIFSQTSSAESRNPEFLFMMECQGCHLADGRGGVEAIPPLNNHVARFLTVAGGREFLAQVPGVSRSALNDEEITLVLNWLLLKFGPVDIAKQYPPFSVDEVSLLRKTPLVEVRSVRSALLQELESTSSIPHQNNIHQ